VADVMGGQRTGDKIAVVSSRSLGEYLGDKAVAFYQSDSSELPPDVENEDLSASIQYSARELVYLGREKLSSGQIGDLSSLEPLYVQKSQAEIRFEQRKRQ
jgi:hypothetical protein